MTRTLAVLPAIIGLALILMGLHFHNWAVHLMGLPYLGYATLIHVRNVNICRQMWLKQRTII